MSLRLNPLNVASGRLALAREERDSEHRRNIKAAQGCMEVLIADLVVVAQRGEPVGDHLAVALFDLCQVCWAGVDTDGISIDGESDRTIQADASRLKQIFGTLSRNVDDHGDDGTVTVGKFVDGFPGG